MLCDSDQYLIRRNVNLLMPEALSLTFKHQPHVHYSSLWNHWYSCSRPNRVNSYHDNAVRYLGLTSFFSFA